MCTNRPTPVARAAATRFVVATTLDSCICSVDDSELVAPARWKTASAPSQRLLRAGSVARSAAS